MVATLNGCQFIKRLFGDPDLIPPEVTLQRAEVKSDEENSGWWFYDDNVVPTKGTKGNHAAVLAYAYIFNIKNPNKVPVRLDQINFTVRSQDFELDQIESSEKMWIPPELTNQLRVFSLLNARSIWLNLLLQGGQESELTECIAQEKDKEPQKGAWQWCTLEDYWSGIPEFKYPVSAFGSANFEGKGISVSVPFSGEYPKK